jgi:hypothetical protein
MSVAARTTASDEASSDHPEWFGWVYRRGIEAPQCRCLVTRDQALDLLA